MPRAVTQTQKEKLTEGLSGLAMLSDADLKHAGETCTGPNHHPGLIAPF